MTKEIIKEEIKNIQGTMRRMEECVKPMVMACVIGSKVSTEEQAIALFGLEEDFNRVTKCMQTMAESLKEGLEQGWGTSQESEE